MKLGFTDEIMNFFKLKLSGWNLNDAIKYYKNDKFCLDYCIRQKYKYGCKKKQCSDKHSINLISLIYSSLKKPDFKKAELLCLYLMYKRKYNNKNAALFDYYAWILMKTSKSQQDFLKSEKYYLKSLSIDNNCSSAHNNYAILLKNKLKNYDKAEYHYNQSLLINPNEPTKHANFALFLVYTRQKHHLGLLHSEKACQLKPNYSKGHLVKAHSLFALKRFDESLKEYQISLKLNDKDGILSSIQIKEAKEQITKLTKRKILNVSASVSSQKQGLPQLEMNKTVTSTVDLKMIKSRHVTVHQTDDINFDEKKQDAITTGEAINMSKFNELSIMDAIDDIMIQLRQVEQIIENNNQNNNNNNNQKNILSRLAMVQNKLASTKTKCCNDKLKTNDSKTEFDDLQFQLNALKRKTKNINMSRMGKFVPISFLVELKKLEQEARIQHAKIEQDFVNLFNDIENSCNNLGGNDVIDDFERKWCQWDVNDAIKWFEYVLNERDLGIILNMGDDYVIEDYNSSGSDSGGSSDGINEVAHEPIDFQRIKSLLHVTGFSAKQDFPVLVKPFQFQRFGFKNKKDCKLLFEKAKQLVKKYPKKRKNLHQKQTQREQRDDRNNYNLEGIIQDTNS